MKACSSDFGGLAFLSGGAYSAAPTGFRILRIEGQVPMCSV